MSMHENFVRGIEKSNLKNSPAALRRYAFVKLRFRGWRILVFIGFKRGDNDDA